MSRGKRQHPSGRGNVRTRVGQEIRMKISELLLREVGDPRVAGVHLTRVEMSGDLRLARLFWRPMPGGATAEEAEAGLAAANAYLRRMVAQVLTLKSVPELRFELDPLPDEGDRIDALLADL